MKEMVGGCCVCSDERGWQENPLVYCDGASCSVAVHQACYGIVQVPAGPWFCEKCASQERGSKPACELCPMREGALKHTDNGCWAHVICALYIPEVRFGNVTTMDPIVISQIPQDRFGKICYLCERKGNMHTAKSGACMECNKQGCTKNFHVTCAQQEGLLCEESGTFDNIKYCGYCDAHVKKLGIFQRRDPNVKQIPPFRPLQQGEQHQQNCRSPVNQKMLFNNDWRQSNDKNYCLTAATTTSANFALTNGPSTTQQIGNSVNVAVTSTPLSAAKGNRTSSENISHPSVDSLNSDGLLNSNNSVNKLNNNHPDNKSGHILMSVAATSSINADPANHHAGGTTTTGQTSIASNTHAATVNNNKHTNCIDVGNVKDQPIIKDNCRNGAEPTSPAWNALTGSWSQQKQPLRMVDRESRISPAASSSSPSPVTLTRTSNPLLSSFPLPGFVAASSASLANNYFTQTVLTTGSSAFNSIVAPTPIYSSAALSATIAAVSQGTVAGNGVELLDTISATGNTSVHINPFSAAAAGVRTASNLAAGHVGTKGLNSSQTVSNEKSAMLKGNNSSVASAADVKLNEANVIAAPAMIEKKRRSEGSSRGSKDPLDRSPKRPRRPPVKKTVKTLLEQVSPVVADTVSSFQKERVAAAAHHHQHQQQQQQQQPKASNPGPLLPGTPTNTTPVSTPSSVSSYHFPGGTAVASNIMSISLPGVSAIAESNYLSGICGPGPQKSVTKVSPASSSSGGLECNQAPPFPTSLEQLLERQWEQGSQFLMDQAQHFDIASLLNCLHQLKTENQRLEEHVMNLASRRDHLLAVNARLSLPLSSLGTQQRSPRVSTYIPGTVVENTSQQQPPAALSPVRTLASTSASTFPVVGGSGVFTSVKHKSGSHQSADGSSPDRSQTAGSFMVPKPPTPLLVAVDLVRPQTPLAALSHFNPLNSEHHQQMLFNLMQQQQAATLAAYAGLTSSGFLTQSPTSPPHRTVNMPSHILHANVTSQQQSKS